MTVMYLNWGTTNRTDIEPHCTEFQWNGMFELHGLGSHGFVDSISNGTAGRGQAGFGSGRDGTG